MKALICERPGRLTYINRAEPRLEAGQALLRIRRVGVCGTDLHAFEGKQPFFSYPRILGHELAAELVDADGATGFTVGEALTFLPYFSCHRCIACRTGQPNCCEYIQVAGVHVDGGMVEYLSIPSSALVRGQGLSLDELALVEPLAIGAHGIRRARVQEGEFVLVIGAGPIGLGAMEFARLAGGKVIAMDINEERLRFCTQQLQVPYTLNAGQQDTLDQLSAITGGDLPTLVIDATGNQKAINHAFQYMAHGGRYVLIGLQKGTISFSHPEFHKREGTLMSSRNATRTDFDTVIEAMKHKRIKPTHFITHRCAFGRVQEAFPRWLNPQNGVLKALIEL